MSKRLDDAALVVSSNQEPKIEVTVTLTSPLMRSSNGGGETGAAAGGKMFYNLEPIRQVVLKNLQSGNNFSTFGLVHVAGWWLVTNEAMSKTMRRRDHFEFL